MKSSVPSPAPTTDTQASAQGQSLFSRLLTREALTSDNALLAYLALFDVVVHLLIANNYGYFRDELYYLEDGNHLAWGYVDQPPLIGWLAALLHATIGESLFAIHIIPALAGGCVIFVTGLMARELGGGRFAQLLAAIAALCTLDYLAAAAIFSMDILDVLWWTLGAYIIIRLIRRNEPRLWLLFGAVAGIGLLNKLTMLFFGLGIVVGLLATPARAYFRTRWLWLGGVIAFVGLLPYALWNAANGWPTVEFWRHYGGLTGGGPIGFLANQLIVANPLNVPLIITGLYFYLRSPAGRPYRLFGWAYIALYLLFTLINAKSYFLAPIYPIFFAGGAVMVTHIAQTRPRWRWLRPAYIVAPLLIAVALAPLAMPILPPATYAQSYGHISFLGNSAAGQGNASPFPQYLADRFGWDTMTETVARVYESLPANERAQACVITSNYGEASALTFLGGKYHLPPVISGHNNYYLWGPGSCSGKVLITVGFLASDLSPVYASVAQAATITCQYCESYENDDPVYVCTQPRVSLRDAWPRVKHFD
ncbi:MAG TPA: glycosyltransferase family 39 protein [Ktedonobacterales bacterium]|nr:glycosyltransferase family 39 protein [Ktedonobacterales bacterium]